MADDLKSQFEQAADDVNGLSQRPGDDDLLELYGLYKQATAGDVTGAKPGMFDFKGRAKYEAWEELAGTDAEAAMQRYVDKAKSLGA